MASDQIFRGARGAGISVTAQFIGLVIQFIGTIALARLLSPTDFGLVAMVIVFVGVGELIRDFGMPTAALQARTLSQQQASSVFWVSSALSLGAASALALCAPLIVKLYDEPELLSITLVMSFVILINGIQAQYQVRLARSMRYVTLAGTTLAARCFGLAVAIALAAAGAGYWALVAQQVASAVTLLVAGVLFTRWFPSRPRRDKESSSVLRAGWHLGGAQLLSYASDNVDTLTIGALWGAQSLGLYNRAFQLFMSPVSAIFSPLTKVVIPTANRSIADGRPRFSLLLRAQSALAGIVIWVLLITSVTAQWLVPLLLGDQWIEIVPLVQILAGAGVFRALSQVNYWAYLIALESRQLFYSNLVTKPLQIALVVGGAFISVEAAAIAYLVGRGITWPINVIWLRRITGGDSRGLGWGGFRLLLSSTVAFFSCIAILVALPTQLPILMVIIGVALSTAIFLLAFVLLPGGWRDARSSIGMLASTWRRR